jgi:hypothetical protein
MGSPSADALKGAVSGSLERVGEALERRGLRFDDAAVWHIGRRVAGELARAHAATDEEGSPAPRLHLRLDPARVRVGEGGEVEVLWPAKEGEGAREEEDPIEWMAPEQRASGRVTHRADVYRFGLLLWWLLTGRRPPGEGKLPALGSRRPDLPGELAAAIDAAIEPIAARRTITCVEIEQWIEPMDRGDAGQRKLAEHLRLIAEEAPPDTEEAPPDTEEEDSLPSPSAPLAAPALRPVARPDRGRLSPLQSIGVAGLTAALVFAIGTYIGDRALRAHPPSPAAGP